MKEFKVGNVVEWNYSNGRVIGKVIKQITKPTKIKGFSASPKDEPKYLVKSENWEEAIHKVSALTLI